MTLFFNRSHGVMVSTLDFESSDPSSNLSGTYFYTDLGYNMEKIVRFVLLSFVTSMNRVLKKNY